MEPSPHRRQPLSCGRVLDILGPPLVSLVNVCDYFRALQWQRFALFHFTAKFGLGSDLDHSVSVEVVVIAPKTEAPRHAPTP